MKVFVVGAPGEVGNYIVSGLLESPTEFDITVVAHQSSINSKNDEYLRSRGVRVVAGDITGPEADLVRLLAGADVFISAVSAYVIADQVPLATAAKKAGVGLFVPCSFGTVSPPTGVMDLRERERVLNYIKRIYLPYTVIDVGWLYQYTWLRLPSSCIDYAVTAPFDQLVGDGSAPSALTDHEDVWRYVARIIADPRTLNKAVFVYNDVLSQQQIFDTLERVSGEKLERKYISEEKLAAAIAQAKEALDNALEGDTETITTLWALEYRYSWGIRGDNTPEHARYLGYLIGKDLYPIWSLRPLKVI